LFGFAVMLDAVARQAKLDHISISNGEAASLGEIGGICGVCIVAFTALARSGWLNKKLWL